MKSKWDWKFSKSRSSKLEVYREILRDPELSENMERPLFNVPNYSTLLKLRMTSVSTHITQTFIRIKK